MYKFIDVGNIQPTQVLPKEALKINDKFIENIIDGYRTLHVEGRELLSSELLGDEYEFKDGFNYKGRRYPSRSIRITYQLIKKNELEYRKAFNTLNNILNVENSKLVFNDEPDMCFVGTKTEGGEIEPGRNCVVGSFTFVCSNPFKHSINENVINVPTGQKMIDLEYDGTNKCFPKIKVFATSDLGFVSFFNTKGGILQIGEPDESYVDEGKKTEVLIDYPFTKSGYKPSDWAKNVAKPCSLNYDHKKEGTVQINGNHGLYASNFGNTGLLWHGPDISKSFTKTPKNWSVEWSCGLNYKDFNQLGNFEVSITKNDGATNVAGLAIKKDKTTGYAQIETYANGKVIDSIKTSEFFDTSNSNKRYNFRISKFGPKLDFETPVGRYEYVIPEIETFLAKSVGVFFNAYSGRIPMTMILEKISFKGHEAKSFDEIPNKFSSGDVLEIDCSLGEIKLNGISAPQLGAIGNTWNDFNLERGNNKIGCAWSSWASPPIIEFKFRKELL